ncbi:hypothetical protein TNCT_219591 [Trichonephila clavata]|uniref:Protein SPT2 homolog n=1 Tax=Trichonephila clavata TaxID=2740835 RepID=A0A8X6KW77_TRICU|nr:hypothetical protein TNCT_219591 [Trichonephila clavata]
MEMNIDFKELLNIADYNKVEAQDEASVKRYSTTLPPPKKSQKSAVQSDGVRRFLEKRKAEEEAKAAQARTQKEKLLALRAQNTKSNKKAKIMASRTKDNDFSRIKLTEDEVASKQKIEQELRRKHLMDKVERMKWRIELEEKEKLQPKKRKRKSKNGVEEVIEPYVEEPIPDKLKKFKNSANDNRSSGQKSQRPAPPPMSFEELLKVAQVKQFEPVEIPVQKKKEERLLTKRERRIFEEEQERMRRKLERMKRDELELDPPKSLKPSKHSSVDEKNLPVEKTHTKKPLVIHVEKDSLSNGKNEFHKFKIPKSNANAKINPPISKTVDKNRLPGDKLSKPSSSSNHKPSTILNGTKHSKASLSMKSQAPKSQVNHEQEKYSKNNAPSEKHQVPKQHINSDREKHPKNVISSEKQALPKQPTNHDREKHSKNSLSSSKQILTKPTNHDREKISKPIAQVQKSQVKHINKSSSKPLTNKTQFGDNVVQKKNSVKIAPVNNTAIAKKVPTINAEELVKGQMLEMEKRLREIIEKEIKEKMLKELQAKTAPPPPAPKPAINKVPEKVKQPNGAHSALNGKMVKKIPPNRPMPSKKENERSLKEPSTSVKRPGPPPPKPFHPNPYLDPPRRRLEPLRPNKPMKRRIESDEDDDDDDDMSDFIDDRTSQNDDDYSKYIQEIFGYDRNKYVDDDDDDIIESNFSQLLKEEKHSAKEGYREDLEEERKLREMEKKRKMKKMKK